MSEATKGTAIGTAEGGTTGAIIGNKMDKQAEEIKNSVPANLYSLSP